MNCPFLWSYDHFQLASPVNSKRAIAYSLRARLFFWQRKRKIDEACCGACGDTQSTVLPKLLYWATWCTPPPSHAKIPPRGRLGLTYANLYNQGQYWFSCPCLPGLLLKIFWEVHFNLIWGRIDLTYCQVPFNMAVNNYTICILLVPLHPEKMCSLVGTNIVCLHHIDHIQQYKAHLFQIEINLSMSLPVKYAW